MDRYTFLAVIRKGSLSFSLSSFSHHQGRVCRSNELSAFYLHLRDPSYLCSSFRSRKERERNYFFSKSWSIVIRLDSKRLDSFRSKRSTATETRNQFLSRSNYFDSANNGNQGRTEVWIEIAEREPYERSCSAFQAH